MWLTAPPKPPASPLLWRQGELLANATLLCVLDALLKLRPLSPLLWPNAQAATLLNLNASTPCAPLANPSTPTRPEASAPVHAASSEPLQARASSVRGARAARENAPTTTASSGHAPRSRSKLCRGGTYTQR
ncbi:hypothetical protein ACCO45_000243 [Purpureocillium lilacinum]|uniref:Uncharacterized protein n=1 Tax=Purpureocillium lilacinum TaxID=33203 RepID=A0ACC4E670_PURLI